MHYAKVAKIRIPKSVIIAMYTQVYTMYIHKYHTAAQDLIFAFFASISGLAKTSSESLQYKLRLMSSHSHKFFIHKKSNSAKF